MKFLKEELNNQSNDSVFAWEGIITDDCLKELQDLQNYDDLRSIIANVTPVKPVSDVLFMGKYLVFLMENVVPWRKPIGEYLQKSFVICAVKKKKLSERELCESLIDSPVEGNPLLVQFESYLLTSSDPTFRFSLSVLQQVKLMYDVFPLPHNIGKQLLFMSSKLKNQFGFPFLALCQGNVPGSLIIYSASVQDKIFSFKLQNQGVIKSNETFPSILNLKTLHLEGFSQNSELSIKTNIYALYRFLGQEPGDNCNLVPVKNADLSVQCTWSDARTILEPLPAECICVANLKTTAGDDNSGAFIKYKEIKLLKDLQLSLKEGSIVWNGSKSLSEILIEIDELANDERTKLHAEEIPASSDKEKDKNNFDNAVAKERVFLTLTDKLWLILKNCSSFETLTNAIQHTYEVFSKLNLSSLVAHISDKSTISKDIACMFDREVVCPNLNQNRVAELLLEIGVEKMRRDYYEFFIGLELVPEDLFNHFTDHPLLSLETVLCLEKLHSVLELTLICVKQLHLPKMILNEFARNALKLNMLTPELNLQHLFIFNIPTFDIRPVLNMMRPVIWEISLKTEDKDFMKQSCHRFVTTVSHDRIYAPLNYNPKLMLKEASYVYSTALLTKRNV